MAIFDHILHTFFIYMMIFSDPQHTHDTMKPNKDLDKSAIIETTTATPTLTTYEEYRKLSAQYRKSNSSSSSGVSSNESVNSGEQLFVKSHSSWF